MTTRLLASLCSAATLMFLGVCAAEELREWRAREGGFSVAAELVEVRDDKVQLKRTDGKLIWVEISKLSVADARYIEESRKNSREGMREGATDEPGETRVEPGARKVQSPFAGMRDADLVLGQTAATQLVMSAIPAPWIAVQRGQGKYQLANIRTGKMFDPVDAPGLGLQKSLSPDGSLLAIADGFPPKIRVVNLTTGKAHGEFAVGENQTLGHLMFLNKQQLLVVPNGPNLPATVRDAKTGAVQTTLSSVIAGVIGKLALSADGRLLAAANSQGLITLIDLKTGKRTFDLALAPVNGNHLSITALGFCGDSAELVVLGTSTASELHCFSTRTGKLLVKHSLSEHFHAMCPNMHGYLGSPVESFPDNKYWMLFGTAIVDREKGGPIWIDKNNQPGHPIPFRTLLDDQRQLSLGGGFAAMRFEIRRIPWDDIKHSKAIVSQGGAIEDAGLPAVTLVDATKAPLREQDLNPQLFQGKRGVAKRAPKPRPIALDRSLGFASQYFFSAPEVGKCLAAPIMLNPQEKQLILIDLETGRVEKTLSAEFATKVHDLSPDAKWAVSTTGKHQDRVDVLDVSTGKHIVGFRPSKDRDSRGRVSFAKFLANDLLLTSTLLNEAVVWKLPALTPLYRFKLLGQAFPFSTSPRFLHRGESKWLVRNSATGEIEGNLEESPTDLAEVALAGHIRGDDSACAVVTPPGFEQKVVAWDLLTGKRSQELAISSVAARIWRISLDGGQRLISVDRPGSDMSQAGVNSVAWCDQNHLLLKWNQSDRLRFAASSNVSPFIHSLVAVDSGRILWDYRIPMGTSLDRSPDGQLWFTEVGPGGGQFLCGASIPTPMTLKAIESAPRPKPILAAGEPIVLDVGVVVSGDKLADSLLKEQVVTTITEHLKQHKITTSDRAAVRLSVHVFRINDLDRSRGSGARLLVTCQLNDVSNKTLWQVDKLVSHSSPNNSAPHTILTDEAGKRQWKTMLTWLTESIDPSRMVERWYYRGLGESILSQAGESPLSKEADAR